MVSDCQHDLSPMEWDGRQMIQECARCEYVYLVPPEDWLDAEIGSEDEYLSEISRSA